MAAFCAFVLAAQYEALRVAVLLSVYHLQKLRRRMASSLIRLENSEPKLLKFRKIPDITATLRHLLVNCSPCQY